MKEIRYSKEELDYIKDTLGLILNDVRSIYNATDQEHIFLETTLNNEKYLLAINDKKIALLTLKVDIDEWIKLWKNDDVNFSYKGNCLLERVIIPEKSLLKKQQDKKYETNKLDKCSDTAIAVQFLLEYDRIREELINDIKNTHSSKEDIMRRISQIRCKYGNEILVDLGENKSLNQQTLFVQEENGKKVGTIDFGSRIVKIITDRDIVLTRVEEVKNKIKTK